MSKKKKEPLYYPIYRPSVCLRSYSRPCDLEPMNMNQLIAYYARVSNPGNQRNNDTAQRLLEYLIDHNHWSPFEMVNAVMEINTTRDIAKQILRHRSFSFQEFSQRYAEIGDFCLRELRMQDKRNRQNSTPVHDEQQRYEFFKAQEAVIAEAGTQYQDWLEQGVAKEQARSVLPEGNTVTRMYMNGTLRSWIHYIQERTKMETQAEHRWVAFLCADRLKEVFPLIEDFEDGDGRDWFVENVIPTLEKENRDD